MSESSTPPTRLWGGRFSGGPADALAEQGHDPSHVARPAGPDLLNHIACHGENLVIAELWRQVALQHRDLRLLGGHQVVTSTARELLDRVAPLLDLTLDDLDDLGVAQGVAALDLLVVDLGSQESHGLAARYIIGAHCVLEIIEQAVGEFTHQLNSPGGSAVTPNEA